MTKGQSLIETLELEKKDVKNIQQHQRVPESHKANRAPAATNIQHMGHLPVPPPPQGGVLLVQLSLPCRDAHTILAAAAMPGQSTCNSHHTNQQLSNLQQPPQHSIMCINTARATIAHKHLPEDLGLAPKTQSSCCHTCPLPLVHHDPWLFPSSPPKQRATVTTVGVHCVS